MTLDMHPPSTIQRAGVAGVAVRSSDHDHDLAARACRAGLVLCFGALLVGTLGGLATDGQQGPASVPSETPAWGSAIDELGHILQANVTIAIIAMVAGWITVGIGTGPVMFGSLGLGGVGLGASLRSELTETLLIAAPHLVLEVVGLSICAASGLMPFIASRQGSHTVQSTVRRAGWLAAIGIGVLIVAAIIEATLSRSIAISLQASS